jgi:hypothetical protein
MPRHMDICLVGFVAHTSLRQHQPYGCPNAYARFRLHSDNSALAGLIPYVNNTYSGAEFDDFQKSCAYRGVMVRTPFR